MKLGTAVKYHDSKGHDHDALVLAARGVPGESHPPLSLAYVDTELPTDEMGAQVIRLNAMHETRVSHETDGENWWYDPDDVVAGSQDHPAFDDDAVLDRIMLLWRKAGRGRDDLDDEFRAGVVDLMLAVFKSGHEHGEQETMANVVRFACDDCDLGFPVEQHTDHEWYHVDVGGKRFPEPCEASDIRSGFARNWRNV